MIEVEELEAKAGAGQAATAFASQRGLYGMLVQHRDRRFAQQAEVFPKKASGAR